MSEGGAGRRLVALTFDAEDDPSAGSYSRGADGWRALLDLLRERQVAATFFLQGDWVAAHPDLARATRDDGHLLGNHTVNHVDLGAHPGECEDQVETGDAVIGAVLDRSVRPWLRLPYLSGDGDPSIRDTLSSLGWRHVGCDIDARDWDPSSTEQLVVDRVVEGVRASTAEITTVMLHTWPHPTVRAVGRIIRELGDREAAFVRLDHAIG